MNDGRVPRRRRAAATIETAAFTLLSIAITWPLAARLTTHAPGSNLWNGRLVFFETPVNLWNLWWFRHAVLELRQSPFECAYLFYPYGANLWFHSLAPLPAAIGAAMQPPLGLIATHNLLVLASFTASGVASAALARYMGLDRAAAFFAGAVYAFAPAVLSHLYVGHFELLWTAWMPAVLLLFLQLLDRDGSAWMRAMLLGLYFAAAAYTSPYYAVYSAELLTIVAAVRWRLFWRPAVLKQVVVAAAIALTAAAPLGMAYAGSAGARSNARNFGDYALEPIAWLLPSFMHPVLAEPLKPAHRTIHRGRNFPQETTGYLGYTVVALAVVVIVGRRGIATSGLDTRDRRLLAVVAAVFLILSLGAELKLLGWRTGVLLPGAAFAELPIISIARAPGRHVIVAMLALAVLAGAGWRSIARTQWRVILVAALAFEYWGRVPLMPTDVPEVYHRLAQAPGTFAVLEIPAGVRDGTRGLGRPDAMRLLGQTVHRKPMVEGMVSRLPDQTWAAVTAAPLICALMHPPVPCATPLSEAPGYFAQWNIRAIVVHPDAPAEDRQLIETTLQLAERERFADGIELWWVR